MKRTVLSLGILTICFMLTLGGFFSINKISAQDAEPELISEQGLNNGNGYRTRTNIKERFNKAQLDTRDRFSNIGMRMSQYLKNLFQSYSRLPDVSSSEKKQVTEDLASDASEIQYESIAIQRVENENELREHVQKIKNFWRSHLYKYRKHVSTSLTARTRNLIRRLDNLDIKINELIERLSETNMEIDTIESLHEKFNEAIELGKEEYENAKEIFDSMSEDKTSEEIKSIYDQGVEELKSSYAHLKEAHSYFKRILNSIRSNIQLLRTKTNTSIPEQESE